MPYPSLIPVSVWKVHNSFAIKTYLRSNVLIHIFCNYSELHSQAHCCAVPFAHIVTSPYKFNNVLTNASIRRTLFKFAWL